MVLSEPRLLTSACTPRCCPSVCDGTKSTTAAPSPSWGSGSKVWRGRIPHEARHALAEGLLRVVGWRARRWAPEWGGVLERWPRPRCPRALQNRVPHRAPTRLTR